MLRLSSDIYVFINNYTNLTRKKVGYKKMKTSRQQLIWSLRVSIIITIGVKRLQPT